jgi:hypothetical protein
MTERRLAAVTLLIVAVTVATVRADDPVRVTPIVTEGRVLVSFTARDTWTLDMREVLQSGLQVRFEYEIEVRRPAPFWFFDSTLARARVSSLARLDTLTRDYNVTRMLEGRVVRSERREQESDVRDWLTTIDQVALDPVKPLEPNVEYYVRVRLFKGPRRNVSFGAIWPFGRDDGSGRSDFTYIR